jgi:hypothetical protein
VAGVSGACPSSLYVTDSSFDEMVVDGDHPVARTQRIATHLVILAILGSLRLCTVPAASALECP